VYRAAAVREPARDDVDMEVVHRLPRSPAVVDAYREPIRRERLLEERGYLLHGAKQGNDGCVLHLKDGGSVHLRDDHSVPRGARRYIKNPDGIPIFIDDVCGNFLVRDFAEKTVVHFIHNNV